MLCICFRRAFSAHATRERVGMVVRHALHASARWAWRHSTTACLLSQGALSPPPHTCRAVLVVLPGALHSVASREQLSHGVPEPAHAPALEVGAALLHGCRGVAPLLVLVQGGPLAVCLPTGCAGLIILMTRVVTCGAGRTGVTRCCADRSLPCNAWSGRARGSSPWAFMRGDDPPILSSSGVRVNRPGLPTAIPGDPPALGCDAGLGCRVSTGGVSGCGQVVQGSPTGPAKAHYLTQTRLNRFPKHPTLREARPRPMKGDDLTPLSDHRTLITRALEKFEHGRARDESVRHACGLIDHSAVGNCN